MQPNFPSESSSYGGGKDYPPHVQRDYKIKNRKKLEDLKLRTFKDILSSFERNDFTAFEQLIRKDQPDYMSTRRLSLTDKKGILEGDSSGMNTGDRSLTKGSITHKAS